MSRKNDPRRTFYSWGCCICSDCFGWDSLQCHQVSFRFPTIQNLNSERATMFQLGCPLWGQETSKEPNNIARDLPLHIKLDPHLPGSPTQCTGNAEARVSQVVIIARKKNTCILHRCMQEHPFLCKTFAFLFYWSFTSLLFLEASIDYK